MSEFEKIKLLGVDDNMTNKIHSKMKLYDVYIKLSSYAADKWGEFFIKSWKTEMDSDYKRVRVSGKHVIIENCTLEQAKKFKSKLKQAE
ncbi:MAG: hypothetical protein V3V72_02040, partial [Ignavibacteriaceae bacterium]